MNYTINTNSKNEVIATTNFEKVGEFWYDGGGVACLTDDLRKSEFTLCVFNGVFNICHVEYNKNYQGKVKGMYNVTACPTSWNIMIEEMISAYNQALTGTIKIAA